MSKCKRCHKEIRNRTSVQQGYGPVCRAKMQKSEDTPTHEDASLKEMFASAGQPEDENEEHPLLVGKTDTDAGKVLFNRFLEDCKNMTEKNRRIKYV